LDIPHDPIILVSFVNTKLRDQFATLEEFCQTYDVSEDELRSTLSTIDYQYDETTNQFV
jgi:O-succinylbenzoate synthase